MKKELSKYLIPFSAVSCAALLAGCASSGYERSAYTHSYMQSDMSPSATAAVESDTDTEAMGGTSSDSGEIKSEQVIIPLHEERVNVGKRVVEAGTVRLRKQVTSETVNQPVQIRRETLVIDRQNADGSTTSTEYRGATSQNFSGSASGSSLAQPFDQGEIVIRLQREEPVVEKQIVPTGKIVVQTRAETEQQNIQREIRRETIDVDKSGDAQNVIVSENLQGQLRTSAGAPAREPQRFQGSSQPNRSYRATSSGQIETNYESRSAVRTEEGEGFPRPQPDGHETFPELEKDPERR